LRAEDRAAKREMLETNTRRDEEIVAERDSILHVAGERRSGVVLGEIERSGVRLGVPAGPLFVMRGLAQDAATEIERVPHRARLQAVLEARLEPHHVVGAIENGVRVREVDRAAGRVHVSDDEGVLAVR
jgi:hypothetical protein